MKSNCHDIGIDLAQALMHRFARCPRVLGTGALSVFLAAIPAVAHHSTASYDLIHGTVLEGVVSGFDWENPHVHILLDVTGEDQIEHWNIEMESPKILHALGWEKDTLRKGDRILVTGGRAKNGAFHLRATQVQLTGGRTLLTLPPPEN